jgi:hypothetical protein
MEGPDENGRSLMDNVDNPLSSLEAALATIESQTAVFLGHLERLKKQALEAHRAARVGNL